MVFDLSAGQALKQEGMQLAATRRKEALAAARQYLIDLALEREDYTATADDAHLYIQQMGLEPLGNAAGSLFRGGMWERTGEYVPSIRKTNHAHSNPIWRLSDSFLVAQ